MSLCTVHSALSVVYITGCTVFSCVCALYAGMFFAREHKWNVGIMYSFLKISVYVDSKFQRALCQKNATCPFLYKSLIHVCLFMYSTVYCILYLIALNKHCSINFLCCL